MKKIYNDKYAEYYILDDGFYKHSELFSKLTKEEKEEIERKHFKFLVRLYFWNVDDLEKMEERDRDPWESIVHYVDRFGLRQTSKHGDLKQDEAKEYIRENGGLDFEDIVESKMISDSPYPYFESVLVKI